MLQSEVRWEQHELWVHGRRVQQPRLVAYMADECTVPYSYSGLKLNPTAWHPAVLSIRVRAQPQFACRRCK